MWNTLLSTKWMPNPPTLQRAINAGHVAVTDHVQGRVYVVAKRCPNSKEVKRSIAFRNKLEIAWAGVVGASAVAGIAWLAHWSNTF
jgi:hypothetical protein